MASELYMVCGRGREDPYGAYNLIKSTALLNFRAAKLLSISAVGEDCLREFIHFL